jgi:acetolactate synthase I/II/III large subunit
LDKKVSEIFAEFLADNGIRHVFGIIGSGNAQFFDAIYRKGFTEIVCMHHEQAAVMAAATYYRTNGIVTAALVTTGAGSTNAVTGVVNLWMDSLPGLIISGNENSKFTREDNPLRIWGIQGYDSTKMVSGVTKHTERVLDPTDSLAAFQKGMHIAKTGRPGPVWIDVPMNIQAAPVSVDKLKVYVPSAAETFTATPQVATLKDGVQKVVSLLQGAQRPLFWLGHGIRLAEATHLIPKLLEKTASPSLVSWAGIDMIDSDHPLVFGRAGLYGNRAGNFTLQNADLVIAIGTRMAIPQIGYELSELAREADICVVDIDPKETAKLGDRIAVPICADAKHFMEGLLKALDGIELPSYEAWTAQCRLYKERFPWVGPEHADVDGFINSYPFMERLSRILKPDQHVITDMGTALLAGHQVLKTKQGQRLMTSTGLGEMGFGLPGAIGISFARDKGEVLCLNCDGGMMMNLQELQTMAHHQLPIKLIIFNNDGYLMIKHTQKALFKGRYAGTDTKSGVTCPDYTKLAKAFDFPAFQIRTWDDFNRVMPQVLEHSGPVICEVFMHPEQLLVPKLSLVPKPDGSIVSPPLEDLSPLLSRERLRENMIIGVHPKSETLGT